MFPCEYGLEVTQREGVGLIVRAISFQDLQPICDNSPPTSQTDGETDERHAVAKPRFAL